MSEELQFLSNQKGKSTLVYNNFQFNKNRKNKDDSTLWRCINRMVCTASVTLDRTRKTVLRESPHTCEIDVISLNIKKAKEDLKKEVCENLGPIQKICETTLDKLRNENPNDQDVIPTFRSLKNSLYRARKNYLNINLLSHDNTETIQIPQALAKDFVICDDGSTDKIIVFATNTSKKIIKRPGSYYADGTFKSAPKPFYQMFVLHVDMESDENVTNIIPVIYALLPNKKEETYVRLLTLIKEKLKIQIKKFKSDYELAIINAVSTVFPQAQITGCYHHFNDAIWKFSKKIKLNATREGRNVTRMSAMIPLVPANLIPEAWRQIIESGDNSPEMRRFRKYFESTWYPRHSPELLSCAGQRNRTTNALEGWHRRINARITKNPNLYYFIYKLRKEAKYWDGRIIDSLFKKMNQKRRLRDIQFDRKYDTYLKRLQEHKTTVVQFLTKVKYLRLSLFNL